MGKRGILLLSTGLWAGAAVTVHATVPQLINLQGQLTDSSGAPLDTSVYMIFTIYNDSAGGTVKWTETHPSISVADGIFSALLGSVTPLHDTVFNEPVRYLGIQVNGTPELTPRVRLASLAYAHRVGTVDGASGGSITGNVNLQNDFTVSGNVGVGTMSPQAKLHVESAGSTLAVVGRSSSGTGVSGTSTSGGFGVSGTSQSGIGIYGVSNLEAGRFFGNVNITGNLSKGTGSFKIDHPLDPANKYLYHSFVESPDMMNIYNGNVTLDQNGEAVVELPDWFRTLNRDFRYQLTPIGRPGPNLYIAEEATGNRFRIAGGTEGMKVSWQVTGIRQDPLANAHRIPVEEEKSPKERGYYLHPDLYGQPEEKSIEWTRYPEMLRRIREERSK